MDEQKPNGSSDTTTTPTKQKDEDNNLSTQNIAIGRNIQVKEEKFHISKDTPADDSEKDSENELVIDEGPTEMSQVELNLNKSSQERSGMLNEEMKCTFSIQDLTPDDEIYTLQCPENYNKQDLCNSIEFTNHKTSFTCKGQLFQVCVLNLEKKFITLALPKNSSVGSLINLPLKGHIVIQKSIEIPIEEFVNDECDKDKVKFPDDIKVRHPLLGVDWKTHVELADAAFNKYNAFRKKHKRRREKDMDEGVVEFKKCKNESSESEISSPKKKRKKENRIA